MCWCPSPIPGTSYDTQRVWLGTKSKAAFTEWTYKFTDQLSATAGIRYTDETKSLQGTMFNVSPATAPEPADCPTATVPVQRHAADPDRLPVPDDRPVQAKFTDTTTSGSVQYRWNDAVMTYVSYSEGFKSGGFNQRYNAAPPGNAPISFGAETATTWELGAKLNPLPSLRVNAALFTTDYDDIQMTYRLGVVPLLFNAGKASIDGGELEVNWSADAPTCSVDASAGYLDSGFDSITTAATVRQRDADRHGHAGQQAAVHAGLDDPCRRRLHVRAGQRLDADAARGLQLHRRPVLRCGQFRRKSRRPAA